MDLKKPELMPVMKQLVTRIHTALKNYASYLYVVVETSTTVELFFANITEEVS
jgi:hypothetical protein